MRVGAVRPLVVVGVVVGPRGSHCTLCIVHICRPTALLAAARRSRWNALFMTSFMITALFLVNLYVAVVVLTFSKGACGTHWGTLERGRNRALTLHRRHG